MFNVSIRVLEHKIARSFQRGRLPVMLEILVALQHREKSKAHRPHVEAGHFWCEGPGWADALFDRHGRMAAGGQIEHRVAALLDNLEEGFEQIRVLVRPTVNRIACMKMDDRGPRLCRPDRRFGYVFRRDRQIGRHRRRMDRAGDSAADNYFSFGHDFSFRAKRALQVALPE